MKDRAKRFRDGWSLAGFRVRAYPAPPAAGPLYATGARTWTVAKKHAFMFTTCSSGPHKDAEEWARDHMLALRWWHDGLPAACAKTTKLKLVAVYVRRVKRKRKAAA